MKAAVESERVIVFRSEPMNFSMLLLRGNSQRPSTRMALQRTRPLVAALSRWS